MNNFGFGQQPGLNLTQGDASQEDTGSIFSGDAIRRAVRQGPSAAAQPPPAPRRRAGIDAAAIQAALGGEQQAPPRRERPRPSRYLSRRYLRRISRFDSSKFKPMTPSARTALFANLSGRAKQDAKRNLIFSFPYYLNIQHIDPARVDALPEVPVQEFLQASYFSELLGVTTDAPHYDFYINALSKGIFEKSLGADSVRMATRYWRFEGILRELPDKPNYYAAGENREPLNDILLFADCIPGANASDAANTRILASLADNIALQEPQVQIPGDVLLPNDLLDVSPKTWLQSRRRNARQAILSKFPNQTINIRDGGTTIPVNTMRAVRLLSGAAWVNHYPNAEGQRISGNLSQNRGSTRFAPTAWSDGVEHIALQSILYYYGSWCYIKARAQDSDYWNTAFEREVLRPEVCRNQNSFYAWMNDFDANTRLGLTFRNNLVSRFTAYCAEQGITVEPPRQEARAAQARTAQLLARRRAAQRRRAEQLRAEQRGPAGNEQIQGMLQLQDQMQQEERQANLRQLNEDLQQDVAIATGREEAPPPPEEEIEVVDIPDDGIVEAEVGVVDIPVEGIVEEEVDVVDIPGYEAPMLDGGDGHFLEPPIEEDDEDEEDTLPAPPVPPEPVKKAAPVKTLAYTAGGLAAVGALVYLLRR